MQGLRPFGSPSWTKVLSPCILPGPARERRKAAPVGTAFRVVLLRCWTQLFDESRSRRAARVSSSASVPEPEVSLV